ncbi:hypothetical protein B0T19DRAFT_441324 [Cercophora scortea]|uniref:Uncharacterized protein n=1 Tax=Cercophora scortea TaxID=314031 RepID=A0AAE0MCN4_9PEZI|nr:hypothetical protein B0T19DRAFT_441324 [Cercophora scortea]
MNAPITSPTTQHAPAVLTSQQSSSSAAARIDFTLVAEAAKRAQMACLMRDMEGVGLS